MSDSSDIIYRYWGKANTSDGNKLAYHLLPYHCLDVAAVASVWWDASPATRRGFCQDVSFTENQVRAWVLFFIALHDYGKFDARFQIRVKPVWRKLYPDAESFKLLPSEYDWKHYLHGEAGLFWFQRDCTEMLNIQMDDDEYGLDFLDDPGETAQSRWEAWKPWIEAVTGHHGHIKWSEYISNYDFSPTSDKRLKEIDRKARKAWFSTIESLFLHPVGLSLDHNPPPISPLLAGFCSVSDWLGSRSDDENFRFYSQSDDLNNYFERTQAEDAKRVMDLSGIISRPRQYDGIKALLKPEYEPRPLQVLMERLPLETGLTIIEAPTGAGKTEAALAYAWRLIGIGLADSIIFALPTQATSNAMLDRLERISTVLFENSPNVLLAHGLARFNKTFARLKGRSQAASSREDGWSQCSAWLAESRKRVFFGQIGVCTVDQVLISVLPVRHRFVRGFGVGRGILIVDEVHAYDAYMYGLLEEVLRQQKASGGIAVLLSATLPGHQRQQLCSAWGPALSDQDEIAPYPLVIWTKGDKISPFILEKTQQPEPFSINIECLSSHNMMPDECLIERIVTAAESGAQVAVVCNLVDVAQQLTKRLRAITSVPVDLFHSRYCFRDRQAKERDAIKRFGPDGKRDKGHILVATQVVEQSLDVDFDWLITQLCPVDLLFQRMGRLHRHRRHQRPHGFEKPICTVLLPEGHNYGLHALIYANTRVLWRTSQKLMTSPEVKIVFPDAYRSWIEPIYQEELWRNEPEEVEAGYEKYKDELWVKRHGARQMINSAFEKNPFADTDQSVTAVTRDGEMNLTLIPFCKMSGNQVLLDGTKLNLLDDYRQLEALTLNSIGVPASWRNYMGQADDKGRFWLEMQPEGESFVGQGNGATFKYHKNMGLEKKNESTD
ncbi:MAG: CRISPR-associated helicase/endonuclease Cas3 [Deltaproteobacteria bacterium]|nr:MAG: CRISPR-associated helicase/endonuclease Cas3 [Deltaproteobacteria bacterium]